MQSLKTHDTTLEFRSKLPAAMSSNSTAFYIRFLRSPNWGSWLHSSIDRASSAMRARYLQRLESGDVEGWADGKSEAEVLELIDRLETEMVRPGKHSSD